MLTISAEVVGSDQIPPVRPPEDAERAFRVTASDFSLAGASNAIAGTQFDFAIGYTCVASLSVSVGGLNLTAQKLVAALATLVALGAPAPGRAAVDRPPQFIVMAFDNCTELERWQELTDFAAELNK